MRVCWRCFSVLLLIFLSAKASAGSLSQKIQEFNASVGQNLLTEEIVKAWYRDYAFEFKKDNRRLDSFLLVDELPQDVHFYLSNIGDGRTAVQVSGALVNSLKDGPATLPPPNDRVLVNQEVNTMYIAGSLARGCSRLRSDASSYCEEDLAIQREPQSSGFPANVPLQVSEYSIPGECLAPPCNHDSLDINFSINIDNLDGFIGYFSNVFDLSPLNDRLKKELASQFSVTVNIRDIFPNWIAEKLNTFPDADDNEVCHGPARQFYNKSLYNESFDRSTDATNAVLNKNYCLISSEDNLAFGDYFYKVGSHSGRFVLTDPNTQRAIVFSIQSGGFPGYRLWWADEDFSSRPFERRADANYLRLVDIWRKCR